MTHRIFAMDTHFMCRNEGPSVSEQAEMVKAVGYDDYYVTSDLDNPSKSLEFLQASAEAGLGFNAVFMRLDAAVTPGEEDLAHFKTLVEALDPSTRIEFSAWHGGFNEKVGDPSADAGLVPWLKTLMPLLEEKGIQACLYPHFGFSLEKVEDSLRLIEQVPHELLGTMFCGYHWYRCDQTPVAELFDQAGDRLFAVNLCGTALVEEGTQKHDLNPTIEPLDSGEMDNAEVLKQLKSLNYSGSIGIQGYDVTAPAEEALTRSLTELKRLIG